MKRLYENVEKWKFSNKELTRFALILLLNFNLSLSCNSKHLSKKTFCKFPIRINYYPGYNLSTFNPSITRIQFNGSWEQWDSEHHARLTKATKDLIPGTSAPSNGLKRLKMETDTTPLSCLSLYCIHTWRDCYGDIEERQINFIWKTVKGFKEEANLVWHI